jgi:hypothetical protein
MEQKKKNTIIGTLLPSLLIALLTITVVYFIKDTSRASRDNHRIADVRQMRFALDLYFSAHGEFPVDPYGTNVLVTEGHIPQMPYDTNGEKYHYTPYTPGENGCAAYHIGISLEDTNTVLNTDADFEQTEGGLEQCGESVPFSGNDTEKCGVNDAGLYCYDLKIPS